ncbi:hypothetical protein AM493_08345 [Flavobacterium akiainvivens]|uniref:LamG-like jellyroll fold domain-containing protein n=1 Tax=Flavobacterium akiainvivens TaxID=1202724 RepID=A0A0M8MI53_9FLAO|nr:LamG domain-containing protein [Flavobacterium akiainvivens]KOS06048.1 hypothetical protein AM493_08345 [Flavobacterium akiainvivens]SFQ54530.1 Concanavalin A-like lectin/glucanases superfamily protein [Flavobacterium akiainvivens]
MKKKIRFVVLSAAFAGAVFVSCSDDDSAPVQQSSCIPTALQDGLVTAYTFGSGNLLDAAGSANLTLAGGVQPGADRDGNPQCAFVFDGTDTSFLSTQSVAALDGLTELSVSLWYKPDAVSGGAYQSLIATNGGIGYPYQSGFWSVNTYDCLRATFSTGNNGAWDEMQSENFDCDAEVQARAGVWHYLTATYSQADGEIAIYRNGVLQETSNLGTVAPAAVTSLFIGKGFKGTIDDVAIYNKVLTQAEITGLFELDACCE